MKKEYFEKLVSSIKEAGEIKSGRKTPSRVYEIKPPEIKTVRKTLRNVDAITLSRRRIDLGQVCLILDRKS